MTQITTTKKILSGVLSLAMVLTVVVAPVSKADAQTTTTTTTTTTSAYTRDLTVGSQGADVTNLQAMLSAGGYLMVSPTGYFGELTKAALAKWQASVGISPASGYFGPITRAYVASMGGGTTVSTVPGCTAGAKFSSTTGQPCTTGTTTTYPAGCTSSVGYSSTTGQKCSSTTTTTTGGLTGGAGSVSEYTLISSINNEEVGEGESDVEVAGLEVEADEGSDLRLTAVRLVFNEGTAGSDFEDYAEEVSISLDGEVLATVDADEFNDNNDWTKTVTLDSNKIEADSSVDLVVMVSGASNIDSADFGDTWTVVFDSVRYVDAQGASTSEDPTEAPRTFSFVSFSSSADTELKISKDSSSPKAGIVVVDDSDTTDDVVLLKGKIEAEGTSDITLDELPVTLTTDGGSNLAAVTGTLTLTIDSEEYSETVTITGAPAGTVTFDDLDLTIDAGDTVNFTVSADINDIDAGTFDEGDTLKASVTATNVDYIEAENEEGDDLTTSETSGSAVGEEQEFRTTGIDVDFVSASTSVAAGQNANDDAGTFTIKFKVTAIEDTVYVSSLADAQLSGNTDGKTTVLVDRAGTATVGGVSTVLVNTTDTTLNAAGLYEIESGESETFELTTSVQLPTAGTAGLYRAVLGGVRWTTDAADATPNNSYTSNLDSFKTSYINLN